MSRVNIVFLPNLILIPCCATVKFKLSKKMEENFMSIGQVVKCALLILSLSVVQMPQIFSDAPSPSPSENDDCSQKTLRAYFPEKFVRSTLKNFNVPEDKWSGIVQGLNNREKDVENIVETKADRMSPNPLKDPQQRREAIKLFKEALFEVASETFKANGITDDTQVHAMLDDIQQQKVKQFAECIEKHKLPGLPHPQQQKN